MRVATPTGSGSWIASQHKPREDARFGCGVRVPASATWSGSVQVLVRPSEVAQQGPANVPMAGRRPPANTGTPPHQRRQTSVTLNGRIFGTPKKVSHARRSLEQRHRAGSTPTAYAHQSSVIFQTYKSFL
jgi:hypothetical protein